MKLGVVIAAIIAIGLLVYLTIRILGIGNSPHNQMADYETKTQFSLSEQIQYPDFVLEYIGKKNQPPVGNLRLGDVYQFTATNSSGGVTVRWSSGTGEIGPTRFTIAGNQYFLELRYSKKFGKLADNELVVTKAGEY